MTGLYGIHKLAKGRKKVIIQLACVVQTVYILIFIIESHPFEQVYFNHFVSHRNEYLRRNYDLDYWDTSYEKGLEYILTHDPAHLIGVYTRGGPLPENISVLPKSLRKRVRIVDEANKADYFMTNFRNHPDEFSYANIVYEIRILNSTIFRVYKIH